MPQKRKDINYRYGWFVWLLGSFFYLFQFLLRSSPNAMADQLMEAFSIHAYSLGLLASCYYYAYSALQIPLGSIIDIWGAERVLKFSTVFVSFGILIFAQSNGFLVAALGRVLIGAGASGIFLSTVHLARTYLPPKKFAFAVGATIMFGKLGGISSNLIIVSTLQYIDWRTLFLFFLFVSLMIAFFVWVFMKNRQEKKKKLSKELRKTKNNLHKLIKTPRAWIIGIYGCLMYLPLSLFTDTWGISFLMKLNDISKAQASQGIILVFVGTSIGAPLIAVLSNQMRSRKYPMILSALTSFLVSSLLIFAGPNFQIANILLFLVGLTMAGQTLIFASMLESVPSPMSGVTVGFINMIVMLGGAFFQPMVGFLLDFFWNGYVRNGIPMYTLQNYKASLSLIPISMLVSFGLIFFVKETYPKTKVRAKVISAEI
jgi:MFS family permease